MNETKVPSYSDFLNEIKATDYKKKKFEVKGLNFVYTDRGRFYGTHVFDTTDIKNGSRRDKFSMTDTQKLLSDMKIKTELPNRYDEDILDKICAELKKIKVSCDYGDYMDVS